MKVGHGKSIYCIAFPCTKLYFVSSHRAPSKYINSRGLRCRRKPYTSLNIFLLMYKISLSFGQWIDIVSWKNDIEGWCIKTKNILISISYTPCSVFNCFTIIHVIYYYMQDADFMHVYCGVFQVINFFCFLKAYIIILPCYVITVVCWTYTIYIHIYMFYKPCPFDCCSMYIYVFKIFLFN